MHVHVAWPKMPSFAIVFAWDAGWDPVAAVWPPGGDSPLHFEILWDVGDAYRLQQHLSMEEFVFRGLPPPFSQWCTQGRGGACPKLGVGRGGGIGIVKQIKTLELLDDMPFH